MKLLTNYISEVLVKTNIKSKYNFPLGKEIKDISKLKENDFICLEYNNLSAKEFGIFNGIQEKHSDVFWRIYCKGILDTEDMSFTEDFPLRYSMKRNKIRYCNQEECELLEEEIKKHNIKL